jgi:hypothetical protein
VVGVGQRSGRTKSVRLVPAWAELVWGFLEPEESASDSVGVGIGDEPHSITEVRGAKGASRKALPLRVIPARGQVSENSSKPSSKEPWHILQKRVSGSKVANESRVVGPKTRALSVDPLAPAGMGEILARASAT